MVCRFLVGLVLSFVSGHVIAAQDIPTPLSHFGFEIGADRKLANWTQLTSYYEKLAAISPRVTVDTLGTTTMDRPFVMLTITSEDNQIRIDELQAIQLKLSDPRQVSGKDELAYLLESGKVVVLITHAIHSTEVGGAQTAARLIHQLASSDDPEVKDILDNVILLNIPSLNPDGTEWVVDWYNQWLDTEYEAAPMPWLYHYYVGHDNNRDWYAFTQKETQHTIMGAHNAWHPQIVHDIHQMGNSGARIFFPPYIDPIEHNVDPAIITAVNMLGTSMAAELTADGKAGVVVNAIYDGFTPARAYQHYHGGARILSETASARLATPITIDPANIGGGRGYDAALATSNFPYPWKGGQWGLPDIVDYQYAGAMALLGNAAKNRSYWLKNFYKINERAVNKWDEWPSAWVIAKDQKNPVGLAYLLRILRMGDVEVYSASKSFRGDGDSYLAGTYVVPMNQPYASFAQTLLETQQYPDLREYPDGPPRRPYDVTAHTLPLLMNIKALPIETIKPGLDAIIEGDPIPTPDLFFDLPAHLKVDEGPRIALYKSWQEPMESGWTRWVFDQHNLQYDTIKNARIKKGVLRKDYDVILFQDQNQESIIEGYDLKVLPDPYAGGLGEKGLLALSNFVHDGGRIIAIEGATELVADLFNLGVSNAVERLESQEFYVPGSILEIQLDTEHPINQGMEESAAVWYWRSSRAFNVWGSNLIVTARYNENDLLKSGWILGAENLAGKAAMIEASIGKGSVVLIGFQPNYRAQTVSTWPLLFNAMNPKTGVSKSGSSH